VRSAACGEAAGVSGQAVARPWGTGAPGPQAPGVYMALLCVSQRGEFKNTIKWLTIKNPVKNFFPAFFPSMFLLQGRKITIKIFAKTKPEISHTQKNR
jgi:hypothetical protein